MLLKYYVLYYVITSCIILYCTRTVIIISFIFFLYVIYNVEINVLINISCKIYSNLYLSTPRTPDSQYTTVRLVEYI